MTVRFVARAFCAPKGDNSEDEYEDAVCWSSSRRSAKHHGRFAIADGATLTSFSREWADLLVKDFVQLRERPKDEIWSRLERVREKWRQSIRWDELPWYAAEKVQRGAFAAFLGLALSRKRNTEASGGWKAWAIGDSCLFQVRDDNLFLSFPVSRTESFSDHPVLLSSSADYGLKPEQIRRVAGDWRSGDRFILATDAAANWFLSMHESGGKPWEDLVMMRDTERSPFSNGGFQEWLDNLRGDRAMRNDDVTVLIVEVEGDVSSTSSSR